MLLWFEAMSWSKVAPMMRHTVIRHCWLGMSYVMRNGLVMNNWFVMADWLMMNWSMISWLMVNWF